MDNKTIGYAVIFYAEGTGLYMHGCGNFYYIENLDNGRKIMLNKNPRLYSTSGDAVERLRQLQKDDYIAGLFKFTSEGFSPLSIEELEEAYKIANKISH